MFNVATSSGFARRFAASYLNMASSSITASPLTIACWFSGANGSLYGLMSLYTSGSTDNRFSLTRDAGNTISLNARTTSNGAAASTATTFADQWNHCLGVSYSATSRFAYCNGAAGSASTSSRVPSGVNSTVVGRLHDAASPSPTTGQILWPAIWNVGLNASEIALLATGTSPLKVRPESLVAFWDWSGGSTEFDCRGNALVDAGTFPVMGPGFAVTTRPRRFVLAQAAAAGGTAVPVFAHHYQQQGIM